MVRYRGYDLVRLTEDSDVDIWWKSEKVDTAPTFDDARKKVDDWLNAR